MVGIYFSGTGNTKYCIDTFLKEYGGLSSSISIEESAAIEAIKEHDSIVFAYPVYYSNLPKIVRDFIEENKASFPGKKIFLIATMGLFSGDGTGCSARLFRKYGAEIMGGLHVKMPDCIGDVKLLKKSLGKNQQIVKEAERKIQKAVIRLKKGKPTRAGLGFFSHAAGLLAQRLWFYNKTKEYSEKLKIDKSKCIGCGLCVKSCPMKNLEITNGKAESKGKCTMCYRCISNCPKQAITLLGKELYEQCKIENYIKVEVKASKR